MEYQEMKSDEQMSILKQVCPTCPKRNRNDNLYYVAWWSYCQTICPYMKERNDDYSI